MARTVSGSGAVIEPIFDEVFGVRAVKVVDGGIGYLKNDPPRLTVTGCGTPDQEALLYPIIDEESGKIIHVRVLERGKGYDPLRLQIIPSQDTPNVVDSFDINRIWQSHPNSPTGGLFDGTTDRITITTDNHPKPTPLLEERAPGGGVGADFKQYTPGQVDYNPTSGLMELTIGSHTHEVGERIRIATNSLTFTCAEDDHATDHTYPRSGDPVHNTAIPILSKTATTITVQVLASVPASNTTVHTFKSATSGAVTIGEAIIDRTFNQEFIYRGGKDVPDPDTREFQQDKAVGIMANGALLHTPEWGPDGSPPPGFTIDTVKHSHIKDNSAYDAVIDGNQYFYQSSKVIGEFGLKNGVFEWGNQQQFVWNIKVEFDNVMLPVENVDETLGAIEVGRTVDEIGGNAKGEISKIVRNGLGNITHIYLRDLKNTFSEDDVLLGSTGFSFRISDPVITFPNGIFYIDFGADAAEFGAFVPGQYYFSPEDIKVQANYLIIWNQSDPTNSPGHHHVDGHPMQFSTTQDGLLNGGTLYYNSTGASAAPSADYENEMQPLFIMNSDETNRIYYYCKNHRYMSGYEGHEGYMILDPTVEDHTPTNNYYITDYLSGPDYSRHADGHSKILGMSFDGYPIYGPYGYDLSGTSVLAATQYGGSTGIGFGENDSPLSTTNIVGSGSGLKFKCTSTGSSGSGLDFEIVEPGSGYAVGDRVYVVHENPNAIFSYGYTSGQNDAARTPGTYNVDITTAMTSGNGNSARALVVVAVGGNTDVTFPKTTEDWTGRGRDFAENETITIPNSSIGGGADIVIEVQDLIDDGWQSVQEITSVGRSGSINLLIAAPIGVGIGTTVRNEYAQVGVSTFAEATGTITNGSITSTTITNIGLGYSQANPPRVIVEKPQYKTEKMTSFDNVEGYTGIITGITTTTGSGGAGSLAFKFFYTSFKSNANKLQVGYPILVKDTSIDLGSGVTSVDGHDNSIVAIGSTFLDNIYKVHSMSQLSDFRAEITCDILSTTNAVGVASTGYYDATDIGLTKSLGKISWGRIYNGERSTSPISIGVTGLTVDAGLSTFPTIQRKYYSGLNAEFGLRNTGAIRIVTGL